MNTGSILKLKRFEQFFMCRITGTAHYVRQQCLKKIQKYDVTISTEAIEEKWECLGVSKGSCIKEHGLTRSTTNKYLY